MFKLVAILAAPVAALCGCHPAPSNTPDVPALLTTVTFEDGSTAPAVTSTYDAGGRFEDGSVRYPATVWHYDASIEEDEAGLDCDARGGSMIDDAAERFVCVTD